MFKQKMILEAKGAEERIYRFECEPNAPLGEIHDALYTMKSLVAKAIQTANDKEKCQESGTDSVGESRNHRKRNL